MTFFTVADTPLEGERKRLLSVLRGRIVQHDKRVDALRRLSPPNRHIIGVEEWEHEPMYSSVNSSVKPRVFAFDGDESEPRRAARREQRARARRVDARVRSKTRERRRAGFNPPARRPHMPMGRR